MNLDTDGHEPTHRAWTAVGQPPRLRLVQAGHTPIAPKAQVVRVESTFACPSRMKLVGRSRGTAIDAIDNDNERRRYERQEGKTMDRMESVIYSVSRFVFGLGIGLALTSAYVIVTSSGDLLGPRTASADVVRLDPVVVTIGRERFAEIQLDVDDAPQAGHVYGSGAQAV